MDDTTRLLRWRLILGAESQQSFDRMGGCALEGEAALMDQALDAIYQHGFQRSLGHVDVDVFSQPGYAGLYPVHRILSHRKGHLKHEIHE